MKSAKKELDYALSVRFNPSIALIDGIAIICIVFHHSFGSYISITGNISDLSTQFDRLLTYFGLVLFSVSSGYKLAKNHGTELQNRNFLKKYFFRRVIRLYKPYIGYSLLVLPFLYVTIVISQKVLNLNYVGLHSLDPLFDNPFKAIFMFAIGMNTIAYHLWYLVTLLEITAFCIAVLYISNINMLFRIGFIVGLFWIFIGRGIVSDSIILSILLSRVIPYGIAFVAGMFFARFTVVLPNIPVLQTVGKNSFYIYLFQGPFLLTIPERILLDYYHIQNFLIPIILTVFVVIASIVVYRVTKILKINKLFE